MQVFLFFLVILSFTAYSSASIFESIFGSKDQCPIKLYNPKDSSFTGRKLYTNKETFHPLLETISKYAKDCRVIIRVKQAFIQENPSLVASQKINHHSEMAFRLGEAIEFELLGQDKTLLCNNICLKKDLSRLKDLPDAKCFLEKLSKNSDLRQDAIKPNLLIRRPKIHESLVKLQDKRKDVQEKCSKLKMDA